MTAEVRPEAASPPTAWPRVSVVVPVYNQAAYVKESLDSVVQTRYPDLEIIVVNDASTDDSAAVVAAWSKSNPGVRVQFLEHHDNLGVTKTLNDGIRLAGGEYVCLLAGDDLLLANGIADRVRYLLDHPEKLAVFADCHVIAQDGSRLYESGIEGLYAKAGMRKDALVHDELVAANIVCHWAVPGPVLLCRAEAFRVIGLYDESLTRCADWDMYLRLSAAGKLGFLPRYVAQYRVHPKSLYSSRPAEVDADNYRAAKKNAPLFREELAQHLLAHVRRCEAPPPPRSVLKSLGRLVNRALFRVPGYLYRGIGRALIGRLKTLREPTS
jgi:glycosyltransferase involved in cell wall biosynthesis